ncbi:enolase [miscellaneous Crenarchaeota group archaeon SMTZ1-55]|nr:MAG: enolase [miscellaneous Crenarchaeota group archaeon SMTZ1-55]
MRTPSAKNLKITAINPLEILDSRGNPTLEVEVRTRDSGGVASVPSGISTGIHEAFELRDGDPRRYNGHGVQTAVNNIRSIIAPEIVGQIVTRQRDIDKMMINLDATVNKSKLGANAILGVSLAVAKAAAEALGLPLYRYLGGEEARVLPVPLMNVINGGLHAGNGLKIQEFLILPLGAITFAEALRMGVEVYHALKTVLREQYGPSAINLGDEGGYVPPLQKTCDALNAIMTAISRAGYSPGDDVCLGLDAAANGFYNSTTKTYTLDTKTYTTNDLITVYTNLIEEYPIVSIEDPFYEEDVQGFKTLTREIGSYVQVVGDDLFVTNLERLKWGIETHAANAILLKVNQIGTLTEALDAARHAQHNQYGVIVSNRSGETTDTYIADIAVALNTGQIKTGATARGERIAKYNRLLQIEAQLGHKAIYEGKKSSFLKR